MLPLGVEKCLGLKGSICSTINLNFSHLIILNMIFSSVNFYLEPVCYDHHIRDFPGIRRNYNKLSTKSWQPFLVTQEQPLSLLLCKVHVKENIKKEHALLSPFTVTFLNKWTLNKLQKNGNEMTGFQKV